jgi:predicted nucleotidyltransferase
MKKVMKITFKQFLHETFLDSPISRYKSILKNRHKRHTAKSNSGSTNKDPKETVDAKNQSNTSEKNDDIQTVSDQRSGL